MCIARVPLREIAGKGAQISTDSFFYQLLIAAFRTDFGVRCQENLERRIRKNNGPDVSPIGDQTGRAPEGPLPGEQRLAHRRHSRNLGGSVAHRLVPDMLANLLVFQDYFVSYELHVHALGGLREARLVLQVLPQREKGDEPVERAALQVVETQLLRHPLGDRAFARS